MDGAFHRKLEKSAVISACRSTPALIIIIIIINRSV